MAFDGSLKFDTAVDSSGFSAGLDNIGGIAKTGLKAVTGAFAAGYAAVGAAVAGLTKSAVENYAEYEQLVGGVGTLFKDSASTVMEYANNAYKTAGMSANEYMTTVTSFSASLLQSLGGDTAAAADKANLAITDMSDNANKMGTDMESIQNAYMGFAKQNYTMLDNLKLGYGGTKEEMSRLLADAQAISGVKYNTSSYADVVDAIHVIQTEMGITGTTALEASSTIQGSVTSAKAAWTNWVTGLADDSQDFDQLTQNLVESVSTAGKNMIPLITKTLPNVVKGISTLAGEALKQIPSFLPDLAQAGADAISDLSIALMDNADVMVDAAIEVGEIFVSSIADLFPRFAQVGVDIIASIAKSIPPMLPKIVDSGFAVISSLIMGIADTVPALVAQMQTIIDHILASIIGNLPIILQAGIDILLSVINGITSMLPQIIDAAVIIISQLANTLMDNLPLIIAAAVDIVTALVNAAMDNLPMIIQMAVQLITSIFDTILGNLPMIIRAAVEIIITLIRALVDNIPLIIDAAVELIKSLVSGLINNIPMLIFAAIDLIRALALGLIEAIPELIMAIPEIVKAIAQGILGADWIQIGKDILFGIGNGLISGVSGIIDTVKDVAGNIASGFKDFFGIHSPSRLMRDSVGINIMRGVSVGMEDAFPETEDIAVSGMVDLGSSMRRAATTSISDDIRDALSDMDADITMEMSGKHARSSDTVVSKSDVRQDDHSTVMDSHDTYNIYSQAKDAEDAEELSRAIAFEKAKNDAARGL